MQWKHSRILEQAHRAENCRRLDEPGSSVGKVQEKRFSGSTGISGVGAGGGGNEGP